MIKVNLRGISNSGPKQQAIARRACAALEQAVNHPDFATRVASASYRETRFQDADGSRRKVPREEIHGIIASGSEMGTGQDATIDLEIQLRTMNPVGSTALGALPISTAFWFINDCIAADDHVSLASHWMHEWLHVAGFYHHPGNRARQDVPYVVQEIVSELLTAPSPEAAVHAARRPSMHDKLVEAECGAHLPAADGGVPDAHADDPIQ